MSRGWKIGLGCFGLVVLVCALAVWAIWMALGRGALVWEGIGDIARSGSSGEAAARYYARALKRRPNSSSLHLKRGYALAKSDKNAEALEEYQEAARLDPDSIQPLLAEARLQTKTEDYPAAAETLKQALAKSPNSAQAHLDYARLMLAQKRASDAIPEFDRALELDRSLTSAYHDLGEAREQAGQREAAIASYREGASRCDWRCRERLAALGEPYQGPITPGSRPTGGSGGGDENSAGAAAGMAFMGVFMVFYVGFIFMMITLTWGGLLLKALAIWDCARRDFADPNTRAMWCLLMVLIGFIGTIVYYFMIYRPNDPPRQIRPQAVAPPGGAAAPHDPSLCSG